MELQESGRVDRRRIRDAQTAPRGAAEARTRAMAYQARRGRDSLGPESRGGRSLDGRDAGAMVAAARGQDRAEGERAFKQFGKSSVNLDAPAGRPA